MAKSFFCIILVGFFCCQKTMACTTFFLNHHGELVFGRNYDWVSGSGMVNINLQGLAKTSFPMQEGKTISWVSRYGNITFNQYGKEFPTGGMNEKGLVVELMWLDGTQYPSPDSRPAISVLQWIQYQLDNCTTVEEVIATDKMLRIATVGTTPLHYLVADKQGDVATIEFLHGKMIIHKGKELRFPVLTNNSYQESLKHVQSISSIEENNRTYNKSSLGRFARTCSMLQAYQHNKSELTPVEYSFKILNEVAQGDFTKWSIVYNLTESRIYFATSTNHHIRSIDFASFNFSCKAIPLAFNMHHDGKGEISKEFTPFSSDSNLKTIRKSFTESRERISIPEAYTDKIVAYQGQIRCQ